MNLSVTQVSEATLGRALSSGLSMQQRGRTEYKLSYIFMRAGVAGIDAGVGAVTATVRVVHSKMS